MEREPPSDWLADSYIAALILLPVLLLVLGMLLWHHSPVIHLAGVIVAAGVVVALSTYFAALQFRVTIELGDDGIVAFGSGQDRLFISHASIRDLAVHDRSYVWIDRSEGGPLVWRASGHFPLRTREANARRVVAAIDDQRDLFRAAAKRAVDEPLLHRSGRDALDFVRDLKTLTHAKVQTYRSAPFDRDRLWRVAENPSAAPKDRIASFIALRVDATEQDLLRLRESADRMVDQKTVRRLSRAMIAAQEEELVEVLELREEDEAALSLPEKLRRRRAI